MMNLYKMLNQALMAAAFLMISFTANAQSIYTITGQLAKDKNGIAVLAYQNRGMHIKDTAVVTNGAFKFTGTIGDPAIVSLELNPPKPPLTAEMMKTMIRDGQQFFLQQGSVTVKSDSGLKEAVITGGRAQADYHTLMMQLKPIQDQMDVLNKQAIAYKKEKKDTAIKQLQVPYQALKLKSMKTDSAFIKASPDSYVAFDLWRTWNKGVVEPGLEAEFMHFSQAVRNTEEGMLMQRKIDLAKSLSAGHMAPDFTLPDTLGKPVSLSSLRGKNVMVCFYMTDFLYFQAFAYNIGRINRRLRDKNFVILGVYYNNRNKGRDQVDYWKSVINENSFNWINVADINKIDGKGQYSSAIAKAYGLEMGIIPQAYLIGPDGKVLARNLNLPDKDLGEKMEALITK